MNVQKPTVLPKQENLRLPNNWILIFEMGFLVDFRPEIASLWTARKTCVF